MYNHEASLGYKNASTLILILEPNMNIHNMYSEIMNKPLN